MITGALLDVMTFQGVLQNMLETNAQGTEVIIKTVAKREKLADDALLNESMKSCNVFAESLAILSHSLRLAALGTQVYWATSEETTAATMTIKTTTTL